MGQKRRRFTREFKLEALRLVEGGRSATEVARELGIAVESIYRWKRELAADHQAFPGNGNLKDRDKEFEELRDLLHGSYRDPARADAIRSAGHAFALRAHTTRARAVYVLTTLRARGLLGGSLAAKTVASLTAVGLSGSVDGAGDETPRPGANAIAPSLPKEQ